MIDANLSKQPDDWRYNKARTQEGQMEPDQIGWIIGGFLALGFLWNWIFNSDEKAPKTTTLKLSTPDVEVIDGTTVGLRNGQEMTIPLAIEMVQNSRQLVGVGEPINISGTEENKAIIRAVIAVENEMMEARGEHENLIVINEANASFDKEIAAKVLEFYRPKVAENVEDNHPLTSHPSTVFEKPDRP